MGRQQPVGARAADADRRGGLGDAVPVRAQGGHEGRELVLVVGAPPRARADASARGASAPASLPRPATKASGRCDRLSTGSWPWVSKSLRASASSSRTLRGQSYSISASTSLASSAGGRPPACSRRNSRNSGTMSSRRSRSGGRTMVRPSRRPWRSARKRLARTAPASGSCAAATIATSTATGVVSPSPDTSRCWRTRSSFGCTSAGSSRTSSRKSVPPCAARKKPGLARSAPVKAPLR